MVQVWTAEKNSAVFGKTVGKYYLFSYVFQKNIENHVNFVGIHTCTIFHTCDQLMRIFSERKTQVCHDNQRAARTCRRGPARMRVLAWLDARRVCDWIVRAISEVSRIMLANILSVAVEERSRTTSYQYKATGNAPSGERHVDPWSSILDHSAPTGRPPVARDRWNPGVAS